MKKIMTKSLMIFAFVAMLAAPVLAADVSSNDAWIDPSDHAAGDVVVLDTSGPGIGYSDLQFSAGVQFYYAEGGGTTFGLSTYNNKGDKQYMTNSDSSKLYGNVAAIAASGDLVTPPASGTPGSDWAEIGK